MKFHIDIKSFVIIFTAFFLSFCGGILNGIIGTGGGIIFMMVSRLIVSCSSKEMYAFAMSCVIPISVLSLLFYDMSVFDVKTVIMLAFPALAGGITGALVRDKISSVWLNKAFALLTVYSGISMIFR